MNCLSNLTIDNYLTIVSIIIVSIGGFFALIQWCSSIKLRRAKFINKIINITRFDEGISKTMLIIDYDENNNWYDDDFHNSDTALEYQIDKLLSYIDYVCYLYSEEIISYNEFIVLEYKVTRICCSNSVQEYLWNLYHYSKIKMNVYCSFINLIDYGIKNKILPDNFKENCTDLFKKRLDF